MKSEIKINRYILPWADGGGDWKEAIPEGHKVVGASYSSENGLEITIEAPDQGAHIYVEEDPSVIPHDIAMADQRCPTHGDDMDPLVHTEGDWVPCWGNTRGSTRGA